MLHSPCLRTGPKRDSKIGQGDSTGEIFADLLPDTITASKYATALRRIPDRD